jgi:hypothetical protein
MVYKHDLRARPIYHYTRESIKADLTSVSRRWPSAATKQLGA